MLSLYAICMVVSYGYMHVWLGYGRGTSLKDLFSPPPPPPKKKGRNLEACKCIAAGSAAKKVPIDIEICSEFLLKRVSIRSEVRANFRAEAKVLLHVPMESL
jgi:hypothetical protein